MQTGNEDLRFRRGDCEGRTTAFAVVTTCILAALGEACCLYFHGTKLSIRCTAVVFRKDEVPSL